jgi:hypothetical protein
MKKNEMQTQHQGLMNACALTLITPGLAAANSFQASTE